MNARRRLVMVAIIASAVLCGRATTHTWINLTTGGTQYWNQDANWDTTFPNAAGADAVVSGNFTTADVSIRLGQSITVGSLTVCDTAADPTTGFSVNLSGSGSYPFTFESAVAGGSTSLTVPTNIAQDPWYQADVSFDPPLYLGGSSPLTVHSEGNLTLGQIYFQGNTLTLTNSTPSAAAVISLGNELHGGGTSHVVANTSVGVVKYNLDYTGTAEVNAGSMGFVGGGLVAAAALRVNKGGLLAIGSGTTYDPSPGQRLPTNTVVLAGGQLNHGGQPLKNASLNQTVGDVVNAVAVTNGQSRVQLTASTTTSGTYLHANVLTRAPGSLLVVAADKLGGNLDTTTRGQQFQVDSAPAGIGAGGAEGTTTMDVLPWLFCKNDYYGHGPDRLGTLSANGLRGLLDSEMDATLAGTDTRNVRVGSLALAADQTVNAIICNYYNASDLGVGRTLHVTSGSVLLRYDSTRLGEVASANAGTVDFGAAEGCVYVNSAAEANAAIGAVVAGSGGLTLGALNGGRIRLTGANTYGGATTVASGIVQVGDGTSNTASARLGTGSVSVAGGALLRIAANVADAVPDDQAVRLGTSGLAVGKVELSAGVNETVKYLFVGDEAMPAGTYGSTASAATTKDDRYFAGTGVLTVTSSATASDPTTLITLR